MFVIFPSSLICLLSCFVVSWFMVVSFGSKVFVNEGLEVVEMATSSESVVEESVGGVSTSTAVE